MDCSDRPLNPEFVLNDPRYAGTQILLARENFGCGSSREHAPWALQDFGIRVIIAPSFADIFFNNCFKNGILPIQLPAGQVDALFEQAGGAEALRLEVDLEETLVKEVERLLTSDSVYIFTQGMDRVRQEQRSDFLPLLLDRLTKPGTDPAIVRSIIDTLPLFDDGTTLQRARELAALYLTKPEITRRNTRVHFAQPMKEQIVATVGFGITLEEASIAALVAN